MSINVDESQYKADKFMIAGIEANNIENYLLAVNKRLEELRKIFPNNDRAFSQLILMLIQAANDVKKASIVLWQVNNEAEERLKMMINKEVRG